MSKVLEERDLDPVGYVHLLDYMGDDLAIVNAAKVSYYNQADEMTSKEDRLLNFLLEHQHMSPVEQTALKFRVKCPLYVSHQWMRHRTAAYNQVSRRYTDQRLEMYIPSDLRTQHKTNKQCSNQDEFVDDPALIECIKNTWTLCLDAYNRQINAGVAREIARGVLPCGMMTEFIYTVNLRNFLHYWDLRHKKDAQYEIRVFADAQMEMVSKIFPKTIELYRKLKEK